VSNDLAKVEYVKTSPTKEPVIADSYSMESR
jgi:hypothetical protein